ncbi:MAG: PD-(D/E)XK nuclease domain-containing protein, partial [Desulfovibrionaceae bacterium]|nr:PD-(D/E)XK nuclease domain-containing protein [Desulfovibrionaceae bacterium]
VFSAMDEYGLKDKSKVKQWYDGFIFGRTKGIYNPWSIINYLKNKEFVAYWANSSSNKIVGDLIATSSVDVKEETSDLLKEKSINIEMDEEIVFSMLDDPGAIWSFLMAAGYVKPTNFNLESREYELTLTNHEVHLAFNTFISNWFKKTITYKRKFIKALLSDDLTSMNINLRHITKTVFSFFDTRGDEPERFYHGFVLGLIVDLKDRYNIKSNRESGDGRYDVTMFPKQSKNHGIVIEFKTQDSESETTLEKTCHSALKQIRKKDYITELLDNNVRPNDIYVYGFAFKEKNVLICGGANDQINWTDIMR